MGIEEGSRGVLLAQVEVDAVEGIVAGIAVGIAAVLGNLAEWWWIGRPVEGWENWWVGWLPLPLLEMRDI